MAARRLLAALLALLWLGCQGGVWVMRDGQRVRLEEAARRDLSEARAHLAAGQLEAAQQVLERFLRELRTSAQTDEALFLLGDVHQRRGEREQAAARWSQLVREQPASAYNAEAALRAARIYRELQRPELGRALLEAASTSRADDELRVAVYQLRAELAREVGDLPDTLVALALSRRESTDPAELAAIDAELAKLLESLTDAQLEELVREVPRGPVYDRLNLAIARRALSRSDYPGALAALERLPARLQPAEEQERAQLEARARRGEQPVTATLGVALPLSGPYRLYGERALRGVALALRLYDDPQASVRVVVADTRGDPQRATAAVGELVEKGASAIIGPVRSAEAVTAAPAAELHGVPLLALARRADLAELGEFVFRLGPTATDEVRALLAHLAGTQGLRRFAILYPDDEYGQEFRNAFWEEVELRGGEIVGSEHYKPGTVDWQDPIRKLVGLYHLNEEQRARIAERDRLLRRPVENASRLAAPELADLPPYVDFEALFIADDADKAGLMLPQLRFFDIQDVVFLGPSSWNDARLVEIAGGQASGAVFPAAFCPHSGGPDLDGFVARHRAAYGEDPELVASQAFDAARLVQRYLTEGRVRSREQLRLRLLETRDFVGVSGLIGFDPNGDALQQLCLLTVRRGAIEPLLPVP
jgi:ABC-type branched-subunit amino acid transport system substrate-binding protein